MGIGLGQEECVGKMKPHLAGRTARDTSSLQRPPREDPVCPVGIVEDGRGHMPRREPSGDGCGDLGPAFGRRRSPPISSGAGLSIAERRFGMVERACLPLGSLRDSEHFPAR